MYIHPYVHIYIILVPVPRQAKEEQLMETKKLHAKEAPENP